MYGASTGRVDGSELFLKYIYPVLEIFFSSASRALGRFACVRARVPLTTNIKNLTTSRDFTPRGARARILSEASA